MTSQQNNRVAIAGGGLAGMAAAVALASAGFTVDLFERRPFLGGRATSYEVTGTDETIDNCQHVVLGCCTNLLDFYDRLAVREQIRFYTRIPFVTPDGRCSVIHSDRRPVPLHLAAGLLHFHALAWRDKVAIVRGMAAVAREFRRSRKKSLDSETMLAWLKRHGQTTPAIEYFWRVVLTSALNEDVERASAWHALQVFWRGFLVARDAYLVGVPSVPLANLYKLKMPGVTIHQRAAVRSLNTHYGEASAFCIGDEQRFEADWFVVALPFENTSELIPGDYSAFSHSPIVGIHLWFDRPVLREPFAALLGRTIQWAFRKPGDDGYVQCVVSAARSLLETPRSELIATAVRELEEFFPGHGAKLIKANVVKEVRATYSVANGVESARPPVATHLRNCFLAGDWVANGWPPTMEGAVRSGYLAAEAITAAAGRPEKFLRPELQPEGFSRWAPAAR